MIVSVDMDDTLIKTGHYYQQSISQFTEHLSEETGIQESEIEETQKEIEKDLAAEHGLKLEVFPRSIVETYRTLVENTDPPLEEKYRNMGMNTFKTETEYKRQGFMEHRVEMLEQLATHVPTLYLVTVGDPRVQKPKITALELEKWFDEICIVPHKKGKQKELEEIAEANEMSTSEIIHIGNSAKSDVQAAVNAGAHAVYLSDQIDWLSDSDLHHQMVNQDTVQYYTSAEEFTTDIPTLFN